MIKRERAPGVRSMAIAAERLPRFRKLPAVNIRVARLTFRRNSAIHHNILPGTHAPLVTLFARHRCMAACQGQPGFCMLDGVEGRRLERFDRMAVRTVVFGTITKLPGVIVHMAGDTPVELQMISIRKGGFRLRLVTSIARDNGMLSFQPEFRQRMVKLSIRLHLPRSRFMTRFTLLTVYTRSVRRDMAWPAITEFFRRERHQLTLACGGRSVALRTRNCCVLARQRETRLGVIE